MVNIYDNYVLNSETCESVNNQSVEFVNNDLLC